ncbi:MAG TPA: hypothetical protein VF720_12980 [Candidatus Eisenbacteria bacterium]
MNLRAVHIAAFVVVILGRIVFAILFLTQKKPGHEKAARIAPAWWRAIASSRPAPAGWSDTPSTRRCPAS